MSVADRVEKALKDLEAREWDNALIQVSIAVDASAKRKFPKVSKVGVRCRDFLRPHENFLLWAQANGGFIGWTGSRSLFSLDSGEASVSDILYKLIRCGLIHDADITDHVEFVDGAVIGMRNGRFLVAPGLVYGLVLVVVGDPVNKSQRMKEDRVITCSDSICLRVNGNWGQLDAVKAALRYPGG